MPPEMIAGGLTLSCTNQLVISGSRAHGGEFGPRRAWLRQAKHKALRSQTGNPTLHHGDRALGCAPFTG